MYHSSSGSAPRYYHTRELGKGIGHARIIAGGLCALVVAFHILGCRRQIAVTELRDNNACADMAEIMQAAQTLPKEVSLNDAIRCALEHNLDAAVAGQDELIKLEARTGARRRMLPSLMLTTEQSLRNREDASKSLTLQSRRKSQDPSYSEEKFKSTINLNLAWNLLDFGIAYFRSRQARNEAKIATLKLMRTRQDLALKVIEAYWGAQVTRKAVLLSQELLRKIESQLAVIRKQIREKKINRIKGIKTETALMETRARLRRNRKEHDVNKAKLAALMGLPVGTQFKLADEKFTSLPTDIPQDYKSLEQEAMRQRPEFFEQDFQEKIATDEARIALASMFPNASLFARRDRDANDFLYYHNWYTAGLNASLDLLSFPRKRSRRRMARLQAGLARKRRMALAIAVIAQVHLAGIDYADAIQEYRIQEAIMHKREELLNELRKEERAGAAELPEAKRKQDVQSQEMLDTENQLFASRRMVMRIYARAIIARARLWNSLGRDPDQYAPPMQPKQKTSGQSTKPAATKGKPSAAHESFALVFPNIPITGRGSQPATPVKSIPKSISRSKPDLAAPCLPAVRLPQKDTPHAASCTPKTTRRSMLQPAPAPPAQSIAVKSHTATESASALIMIAQPQSAFAFPHGVSLLGGIPELPQARPRPAAIVALPAPGEFELVPRKSRSVNKDVPVIMFSEF